MCYWGSAVMGRPAGMRLGQDARYNEADGAAVAQRDGGQALAPPVLLGRGFRGVPFLWRRKEGRRGPLLAPQQHGRASRGAHGLLSFKYSLSFVETLTSTVSSETPPAPPWLLGVSFALASLCFSLSP